MRRYHRFAPLAMVLASVLLMSIIAQIPQSYAFSLGVERGPKSDLPFLTSFYPPEGKWPDGMFRWSRTEYASLFVPAQGRRGLIVELNILGHKSQRFPESGPTMLRLQTNKPGVQPEFALRQGSARYLVYVPADALSIGALSMRFVTPTWQNEGDSRDELGIALGSQLRIRPAVADGLVLPDLGLLLSMSLGLVLLWAAVRIVGFGISQTPALLAPVAFGLPWLLLVDPGRMGFVGMWMPVFGLIVVGAALVCAKAVPLLLRGIQQEPPISLVRWLLLVMALTFALKYAGRWFPDAMPGDWQLHVNRFTTSAMGDLSIRAQHRGLPFPFPPGYYVLIAPLLLSTITIATLLPFLAAVWETLSVLVMYLLVAKALESPRLALLAAAIYTFTAAGFMNTWFSFHTQVSTQMFTALLMLTLVWAWPDYTKPRVWFILFMLLSQMFLGHIGTFMNAGLMGLIVVVWGLFRGQERRGAGAEGSRRVESGEWRVESGERRVESRAADTRHKTQGTSRDEAELQGDAKQQAYIPASAYAGQQVSRQELERRSVGVLALVGVAATLFALLCFYTLFAGLIGEQIRGVASGGLVEVSGKKPLAADVYLRSLWYDGLITHYGFFPVVLAVPGALALMWRIPGSILPRLVWATFVVSAGLGLLPFLTQSAIMTRWLTFAAWAVAVAGAMGLALFWRRGRAARLVTFAMTGYVLWITAVVYAEAMTQRLPPVEPF